MELRSKIKDECCVEELEEMIVNYIKAGFWSNEKILMDCLKLKNTSQRISEYRESGKFP